MKYQLYVRLIFVHAWRKLHTSALHQKGDNVTRHKDLGQPIWTDQREGTRIQQSNNPAQNHVHGRGEQGWSKKEEQTLANIRLCRPVRGLLRADVSAKVTNSLNYKQRYGQPVLAIPRSLCSRLVPQVQTTQEGNYTQTPPIMKAVMNQALAFAICQIWITVVKPKIAANATAAPAEGS
jgi:hypothetical protein